MAKKTAKTYKVKVVANPNFCGIDAGGVQFAYGEAIVPEGRMLDWFREHDGYAVTEVKADDATDDAKDGEKEK